MIHTEEEAMKRLVRAIVGDHDVEGGDELAKRVLSSNIAGTKHVADAKNCWRRISRKHSDSVVREIQSHYKTLERYSFQDNDLPPKLLTVLTKLMGKQIASSSAFASLQVQASSSSTSSLQTTKKKGPTVSKAVLEQQIRHEKQTLAEEEALLLRECLYSLQGINGERIIFSPDTKKIIVNSPAVDNPLLYSGRSLDTRLGSGSLTALKLSGEAGFLYSQISHFIHTVQQDETKSGVISRAFAGTLAEELREYHSLLASYESKLPQLTLRQLLVDLRNPTNRLKILALVTDALKDYDGGHLLSGLYKHTLHGDSRHSTLVKSVLAQVSQPWFDILYRWTTQGLLMDPHEEFFVLELPEIEDKYLWMDKYQLRSSQIPFGLVKDKLVQPAFNVGKGINFIRKCLLDGKWTMKNQFASQNSKELGYSYHSSSQLEKTLEHANALVNSHILTTLKEENHLMDHLFALKQFLFLGQGDFFSTLVEGLFSEFHLQPQSQIYKHSLLGIVEGALRSTNAKCLPSHVLDRLQVELLLPDKNSGNDATVWDIFMLDYQVPDPLLAIVHPKALDQYKQVFSLLLEIKKVEFLVNYTWRQSATLQHALYTTAQYNAIPASHPSYQQASVLLRKISIARQSMMHLIVNLKSYLMFEVVEGGFHALKKEIEMATTLDQVIDAHDAYLQGIVRKSLFTNNPTLAQQIVNLLDIAGDFCHLQETLFREALLKAAFASEKRLEAEYLQREGKWGFSENMPEEEETFFGLANSSVEHRVEVLSSHYNENVLTVLGVLGEIVNGGSWQDDDAEDLPINDLDPQRFLMAQLDHNQYYGSQQQ